MAKDNIKIPTFHYSIDPLMTMPVDKIAYIIKHFIYSPGFTSTEFSDMELSLRGMVGRYPKNPPMAVEAIITQLDAAFKRVVPEMTVNVDAKFNTPDPNSTSYTLELSITDALGNFIIPVNKITVKDQQISIEYEGI